MASRFHTKNLSLASVCFFPFVSIPNRLSTLYFPSFYPLLPLSLSLTPYKLSTQIPLSPTITLLFVSTSLCAISMTGKRAQNSPVGSPSSDTSSSKEQDRFLPIANVSRIMKKSLPANAKISKEAKETVQECVSEFISFITGEASDKCQREKRKTINGDDLLWAMTMLGFENYVGPLKVYLSKYRETEGEKNNVVARHEDQSAVFNSNQMNKANKSIPIDPDFQGFNGGFYSLGPQMNGDEAAAAMGYGDSLVTGAFNRSRIRENDGNGNRIMASYSSPQWS